MEITVEYIEKELKGLRKQHEQVVAQLNMIAGAITALEALKIEMLKEGET